MRIYLLYLLLICFSFNSQAQQLADPGPQTKASIDLKLGQSYLKKARTQKIIGFSLLGTGFSAMVAGILISEYSNYDDVAYYDAATALAVVGVSMMATSIPFFIIGAKNKGRAEVLLHDQKIFGLGSTLPKRIPAIGIAVPINGR